MSRFVSELFSHPGTLYVHCSSLPVKRLFAQHLMEQGFRFGDGVTPAKRQIDSLMCVHRDRTISFCGFVCRMQCGSLRDPVYVEADSYDGCTRVDYARYAAGAGDYVLRGKRPSATDAVILEYW